MREWLSWRTDASLIGWWGLFEGRSVWRETTFLELLTVLLALFSGLSIQERVGHHCIYLRDVIDWIWWRYSSFSAQCGSGVSSIISTSHVPFIFAGAGVNKSHMHIYHIQYLHIYALSLISLCLCENHWCACVYHMWLSIQYICNKGVVYIPKWDTNRMLEREYSDIWRILLQQPLFRWHSALDMLRMMQSHIHYIGPYITACCFV